ncbi:MAG: GAF domain-containing protein [Anaerolineales bacterium]|nr:GAF domain-containing protein [Anaerolineales bacterium]
MDKKNILIILADSNLGTLLEQAALRPAGHDVTLVAEGQTALTLIKAHLPDVVILGEKIKDGDGLLFATRLAQNYPQVPVILIAGKNEELMLKAIRIGVADYLSTPVRTNDVLESVECVLKRRSTLDNWVALEARRNTKSLRRRLDILNALQQIGRSVTASLNLDDVLTSVVDSAVELTGAEESSLLLLDETTGELYMRAARNFQDEFVRTFRLPIRDSLAGQVLRTGQPITFHETKPQKIKTSYLVHTLVYVPLQVHGRVIGVLGIDNRQSGHPFSEDHVALLSALADYAAIAVENARLFSHTEMERSKLETILTHIEDGVIVTGLDGRLLLANQTVRDAFSIQDSNLFGHTVHETFQHPDLLEIFDENKAHPSRSEISLDDGRVFNAQSTPIPGVGLAITMQDITHLKELDRIKTDFVNTVSHDLRSPLTAILGYVELISRAGPVTDQQREFIRRIQLSVNNITSLINDLLDLGRIEAGFDARKEIIHLPAIIHYAIEGLRNRITDKNQEVIIQVQEDLPMMLGNPIRMRQMLGNLIVNAIKFTPPQGKIEVKAHAEEDQIILHIIDNGLGIPPADQPYIFDRFYRGSNVPSDSPGTGLGLAIVKSIVENHQGRIWLASTPGQGTTFTLVFPVTDQTL